MRQKNIKISSLYCFFFLSFCLMSKRMSKWWHHVLFRFTQHPSFFGIIVVECISLQTFICDTCWHMWSMLSPSNMRDCWLSSRTGPHPELTVAAAVLVLLVIVIISLIVLVVIWKQVLAAIILHSFSQIHSHLFFCFLTSLRLIFLEWISKMKPKRPSLCLQLKTAVLKWMMLVVYYS